jgi:hypothetical protein
MYVLPEVAEDAATLIIQANHLVPEPPTPEIRRSARAGRPG